MFTKILYYVRKADDHNMALVVGNDVEDFIWVTKEQAAETERQLVIYDCTDTAYSNLEHFLAAGTYQIRPLTATLAFDCEDVRVSNPEWN